MLARPCTIIPRRHHHTLHAPHTSCAACNPSPSPLRAALLHPPCALLVLPCSVAWGARDRASIAPLTVCDRASIACPTGTRVSGTVRPEGCASALHSGRCMWLRCCMSRLRGSRALTTLHSHRAGAVWVGPAAWGAQRCALTPPDLSGDDQQAVALRLPAWARRAATLLRVGAGLTSPYQRPHWWTQGCDAQYQPSEAAARGAPARRGSRKPGGERPCLPWHPTAASPLAWVRARRPGAGRQPAAMGQCDLDASPPMAARASTHHPLDWSGDGCWPRSRPIQSAALIAASVPLRRTACTHQPTALLLWRSDCAASPLAIAPRARARQVPASRALAY